MNDIGNAFSGYIKETDKTIKELRDFKDKVRAIVNRPHILKSKGYARRVKVIRYDEIKALLDPKEIIDSNTKTRDASYIKAILETPPPNAPLFGGLGTVRFGVETKDGKKYLDGKGGDDYHRNE